MNQIIHKKCRVKEASVKRIKEVDWGGNFNRIDNVD